ncbi:MAG TPA: pyridoxal-phosphate dependent enzyme [Polyangia bacterium]|jgi:cystathionine beta-synthase|nr:pyridoxal-phosphate dependent enzyme [Polyangia bacterium]
MTDVPTSERSAGVLALIGNTPLVRLESFDAGPCELFVKLESQNPGGSIKDRIGLAMIEAAERAGHLRPGALLVEATAGNTGLGLALVAGRKGYRLLLVIPDKMSQEKIFHLRALGADVRLTRSDVAKGDPEYYQDLAARLAREMGGFYVNQFENPANPLAHETTTGPEIWRQMNARVDAVVCGVGSGGTITGLSRYFARTSPDVEMVLADPAGSILADYVKTGKVGKAGSWLVEGIGEDFVPSIADLSRVQQAFTITDEESLTTARALLRGEGILAGSSSGTLVAAALRYCRAQTEPKRVVTFVCDSGNKYLSKMFNDYWMRDQGLLRGPGSGDLRDLISRSAEGAIVALAPTDTLTMAYARMKLYDVSQLPVLDHAAPAERHIAGILDESDLLLAVSQDAAAFRRPVRDFMTSRLETVAPSTPVAELLPIFEKGMVALVVEDGRFLGLITRIDVLNYLRRRAP